VNVRYTESLYGQPYPFCSADFSELVSNSFRRSKCLYIQGFAQFKDILGMFFCDQNDVPGVDGIDVQKQKKITIFPYLEGLRFPVDNVAEQTSHTYNLAKIFEIKKGLTVQKHGRALSV